MHKLASILDKGTRKHMAVNQIQNSCYMMDTIYGSKDKMRG